ncbi:hypothetical protein CHLRE_01g013050v5 [Chlamydomonas reinhardtii]|uniref:F-box domain-containing protein n=1 Tax=Chlamydomonas reinhardtii TaxID=3055 RepID=A0A2K3E5N2_CHLRE|nr:uncharacterized protein CHLRE_01g013050v5 [Chlamydomonas reinhardtii]PNW88074.1 hypothetical protein CHLRE_01g013050v5 [Chlamydomonas reinhardtii]
MASDNAPAGPLLSEESSACLLDRLDSNILVSILSFLTPREVVTASLTCKQLAAAAEAPVLWRQLYDSALCPRVKERHLPHPSQISDWRGVVVRGLLLRELPHGAWERLQPEGNRQLRPCPREGHAASSWGRDSMILFGGWGSGIRNDLYILERVAPTANDQPSTAAAAAAAEPPSARPAGRDEERRAGPYHHHHHPNRHGAAAGPSRCPAATAGAAAAADAAEAAAEAGSAAKPSSSTSPSSRSQPPQPGGAPWVLPEQDEPCGWQWRVPRVAGRKPPVRYGHSATRCGPDGGWLAVYGGMQAGGYAAEISSLALLRPFSGDLPGTEDLDPADYEYEWYLPQLSGADPGARGYHSACASEDGMRLFVFGGIARRGSTTRLSVIDLRTLTVDRPTTTGGGPSPRFGCSLFCYGGKLWVVGGGNGSDLARSGVDLFDVWTLDLKSWEWAEVKPANEPHDRNAMGRCHASVLLGSKLLMFGGSLELGNHITWLDVGACPAPVWGHPAAVLGAPPGKRMSAVAAISRTDLLVFGGWIYSCGEMGDLHRYKLLLSEPETRRARDLIARADAAAAAAAASASSSAGGTWRSGCGGNGNGGGAMGLLGSMLHGISAGRGGSAAASGGAAAAAGPRRGPVTDAAQQLSELLSSKIARYYTLMREAQEREERSGHVPLALVRQMHETMMAIRLLRNHAREEGLGSDDDGDGGGERGGPSGWTDDDDDEDDDGGGGDVHVAALFGGMGQEDSDDEESDEEEDEEAEGDDDEDEEEDEDEDGPTVLEYDPNETGEEETDAEEAPGSGGSAEGEEAADE